jgi:hypothetical protein
VRRSLSATASRSMSATRRSLRDAISDGTAVDLKPYLVADVLPNLQGSEPSVLTGPSTGDLPVGNAPPVNNSSPGPGPVGNAPPAEASSPSPGPANVDNAVPEKTYSKEDIIRLERTLEMYHGSTTALTPGSAAELEAYVAWKAKQKSGTLGGPPGANSTDAKP